MYVFTTTIEMKTANGNLLSYTCVEDIDEDNRCCVFNTNKFLMHITQDTRNSELIGEYARVIDSFDEHKSILKLKNSRNKSTQVLKYNGLYFNLSIKVAYSK